MGNICGEILTAVIDELLGETPSSRVNFFLQELLQNIPDLLQHT
jgi:hypothetical protein